MPRRKLLNEADARHHLAAAAASGRSLATYARANGIDGRSLNSWQINLSRRAPTPTTVDFVELVAVAGPARPPSALRVCRGDLVVEVPVDFDGDHLTRVLRAVAAC